MNDTNDVLQVFDSILDKATITTELWSGKRFEKFRVVQIDTRGEIGELFVTACLRALGKVVNNNNRTQNDKDWDLVVVTDDIYLEIKTASLGTNKTFQHENLDKSRNFDGVIFVDIAPDDLYLKFMAKHLIPWKKLHRRKDSTYYKWDWKLKDIQDNKTPNLAKFLVGYKEMLDDIKKYKDKQKPKSQR